MKLPARWQGALRPAVDWWHWAFPVDREKLAGQVDAGNGLFDYANHILTTVALWAAVLFGWYYLPKVPVVAYLGDHTSMRLGLTFLTVFAALVALRLALTTFQLLNIMASGLARSPYLPVRLLWIVPAGAFVFVAWGFFVLVVGALSQVLP
jgi:hypothetical protein